MNTSARLISVVIPNFNGRELLAENLPSVIKALEQSRCAYEIIIADDASTDTSLTFLEEHYHQIQLVKNTVNKGFSPNINSGIKQAKGELVLLLNSDVQLSENYFEKALPYFSDPMCFGVQGCIMGMDRKTLQDAAKYPILKRGNIKASVNYELVNKKLEKTPSFFLSGANALVCREKLTELGGFLELFAPFYFEDVDLSLRAWRKGWSCYYEANSICYHPNSVTIQAHNKAKKVSIIAARNKLLLHALHLAGMQRVLWQCKAFFKLASFKQGYWFSYWAFWSMRTQAAEARKHIQNTKPLQACVDEMLARLKGCEIRKF